MKPTLILGLGNPLQGDDGVGCRVIEALERQTLPEEFEILDGGTPGVGLVNLLEGRQQVIIIDAAEMGEPPGTVRQFSPEALTLTGSVERFSLHRSGVADALALAHTLGMKLPRIVFYGVQPLRVGWGEELSAAVQAAVPRVVTAILQSEDTKEAGADHGQ